MVNEAKVQLTPDVTATDDASVLHARSLVPSIRAHLVAVPDVVVLPSVIAEMVTCLPFGEPAPGAPIVGVALFPRLAEMTAARSAGSDAPEIM